MSEPVGLGNGVGAYMAAKREGREVVRPIPIGEAEDTIAMYGYDGIEFFPIGREWGARSWVVRDGRRYKSEAGPKPSRELAAATLVRTITRK